jgi:hypothetical protein
MISHPFGGCEEALCWMGENTEPKKKPSWYFPSTVDWTEYPGGMFSIPVDGQISPGIFSDRGAGVKKYRLGW